MDFKKGELFSLLFILVITTIPSGDLFSQATEKKPSRQSSIETFSKGMYETAYSQFSELLVFYPKDPLYKYYSGVCLVKLSKDPEKAAVFLQQSLQGAAAVRSIPSDALFYLGRAQQMSGRFSDAITSYKRFEELSGKKVAKDQGVPEYILECNRNEGKIQKTEQGVLNNVKQNTSLTNDKEENGTGGKMSQPPVNLISAKKSSLPPDYEKLLDDAFDFQVKADSISAIADKYKSTIDSLPLNQKAITRIRIREAELLSDSFQKAADAKYSASESLKSDKYIKSGAHDPERDNLEEPVIEKNSGAKVIVIKESGITKDSVIMTKEKLHLNANIQNPGQKSDQDSVKKAVSGVKIRYETKKDVEIFSVFEVVQGKANNVNNIIKIDPEVPQGLIYRIQVAVFRNPVAASYFKGITPVIGLRPNGNSLTNYYAGMFRRSSDASKALIAVKSKGFKDAFVVAFSGAKVISAERAAVLEKEWGRKPLLTIMEAAPEVVRDTMPPALAFRVEVMRTIKAVKDDIADGIKKMAGNRGMDIQIAEDGKFIYLIGKFITFESAAEYSDLIIRNGYKDAKVVAWLGKREIPVETARKLFEQLE